MRSRLTRWAFVLAPLTGIAMAAEAQIGVADPVAPGTYAITNARIVPVSGATIERGTIVIRNGLIAAVGASVTAPADARIVDGAGLSVYPGIIDALSNTAIPAPRQGGGGGGPQPSAEQSGAPNSLRPAGLQPEVRAIDLIRFDADALEAPRNAGITATLTAPRDGIFAGQSALINLDGANAQDALVRSPVALHVGFTAVRGREFPNSLLGVFAALRQTLLDAQRYRDVHAAYARSPRGMARPDNDPSLAALQPVLAREMPVIMMANTQREIERALDLAAEFNLRAYIAGGEEAWKVSERLRREGVPVLVSLNFPRPPQNPGADADPEPVRVLQARVDAPKNPGRLAAAGVRVAFASSGVGMNDYLGNARKAVAAGMSRDAALRALTLAPAELFGVADRLGTIEIGKIANLTVSRGDLLDPNGRVTHVFIDGRMHAVRATTGSDNAAASAASGAWTVTVTFPEGDRTVTLNLTQEGERLRGNISGSLGSSDISNASLGANGDLQFTVPVTLRETSEEANFAGTLTGNVMRGSVQVVGHPNGTFVGTRPNATGPGGQAGQRGGQRPPSSH